MTNNVTLAYRAATHITLIFLMCLATKSYSAVPYVEQDNWNNYGQPIADGDMGAGSCVYNNSSIHPVEFSLPITEHNKPKHTALLAIYANDVDFPAEIDEVYVNGYRTGRLIGQNGLSHTSLFMINDIETLRVGNNIIRIYVDREDIPNRRWCLNTEKAHFILDEGFSTSIYSPGIGNGPGAVSNIRALEPGTNKNKYIFREGETVDILIRLKNWDRYPVTLDMEAVIVDHNGNPVSFYKNSDRKNIIIQGNTLLTSDSAEREFQFQIPDNAKTGYNEYWTAIVSIYDSGSKLLRNVKAHSFKISDVNNDWINLKSVTLGSSNSNLVFQKSQTLKINGRNLTPTLNCWIKNEFTGEYITKNVSFSYIFSSSVGYLKIPYLNRGSYELVCSDLRTDLFGNEKKVKDILPNAFRVTDTAYLLLHGLNSSINTWDDVVDRTFQGTCPTIGAMETGERNLSPCYRLAFGIDSTGTWDNGDGYNWNQLGKSVFNAARKIYSNHKNRIKNLVLVGHSRGGIAARNFLQNTALVQSVPFDNYGLITIGTPHKGSPLGNLGLYFGKNGIDEHDLISSISNDINDTFARWLFNASSEIAREHTRFLTSPSVRYLAGSPNSKSMNTAKAGKNEAYTYLSSYQSIENRRQRYGEFYDAENSTWNDKEAKPWLYKDLNSKTAINNLINNTSFIGQITSVAHPLTLNYSMAQLEKYAPGTIGREGRIAVIHGLEPWKYDSNYCDDKKWNAASWSCNGDGIVPFHSQDLRSLIKLETSKDIFVATELLSKVFHMSQTGKYKNISRMFNQAERNIHNSGGDIFIVD